MAEVFLVPGLRTPFVKAGTFYAGTTGLQLSAPIAAAMNERAKPDFLVWGQVIPDPTISNIARELIFEAKLSPRIARLLRCDGLLDELCRRDPRGRHGRQKRHASGAWWAASKP